MKSITPRRILLFLTVLTLLTAVWSLLLELQVPSPDLSTWFKNYLQNFSTGTLGAVVTFLLIDLLLARRDKQHEKETQDKELRAQLIADISSDDEDSVVAAVKQLTKRGWLRDGSLRDAIFTKANLQGLDLSFADLCGAHLGNANLTETKLLKANLTNAQLDWALLQNSDLTGATLDGANLWKANLTGARGTNYHQLSRVRLLRGATLFDGRRYDGRFNLPGDLEKAESAHIDLGNPKALAEWYGVTLEEFLAGQGQ